MADIENAAFLEPFNASKYRVGIAVGLFNGHITKPMEELAIKTLTADYQIPREQITVIEVAGAADMPVALETLARNEQIDCLMSIGAIIRGSTAHFDYVAKIVADAVCNVQINHAKPVAFGVLTTDTEEQAVDRIEHAAGYVAAAVHAKRNLEKMSTT